MDSQNYKELKTAVLRAYKLVPEDYQQRFRKGRKSEHQIYVEFVRDLLVQFNRWCVASEIKTFEALSDLITLEQFKNCVPVNIATYITEES